MDENKSGLYIVAIVGIIAVVALVIMVTNSGRNQIVLSSAEDASGDVKATASVQTACEKHCGVAGIYQENPCMCKNPTA